MSRKSVTIALAIAILFSAHVAEAQTKKVARIGWLSSPPKRMIPSPFMQGLRELGWFEGQNIAIERRFAKARYRLPQLASELVQLKVEVIVAGDSLAIGPAKRATTTIPIVMTVHGDPISAGHVVSLARPGGNITGLSIRTVPLAGKRLQILREVVPNLSRVAILGPARHPEWKELETVSRAFGIQLQPLVIEPPGEFATFFQAARSKRAKGLLVVASHQIRFHSLQLIELAEQNQVPAMYPTSNYVADGGLMAYGVDMAAMFRRASYYVDRILRGVKPSDLPVEQPMKVEFIVNLKAAKQISLAIPPEVLQRADKVIR